MDTDVALGGMAVLQRFLRRRCRSRKGWLRLGEKVLPPRLPCTGLLFVSSRDLVRAQGSRLRHWEGSIVSRIVRFHRRKALLLLGPLGGIAQWVRVCKCDTNTQTQRRAAPRCSSPPMSASYILSCSNSATAPPRATPLSPCAPRIPHSPLLLVPLHATHNIHHTIVRRRTLCAAHLCRPPSRSVNGRDVAHRRPARHLPPLGREGS